MPRSRWSCPRASARPRPAPCSAATGKPEVPLLYDPSHTAELALVRGLLTQHAMQAVSQEAFSADGIAAQIQALDAAPMEPERKAALKRCSRTR